MAAIVSQASAATDVDIIPGEGGLPLAPSEPAGTALAAPDSLDGSGGDIGNAFGFQPTPTADRGECWAFAEFRDGEGYCMDSVVSNRAEAYSLGKLINGRPISAQEQNIVGLLSQLNIARDKVSAQEEQALEQQLADAVESWLADNGN
jgi:hypothetical protein